MVTKHYTGFNWQSWTNYKSVHVWPWWTTMYQLSKCVGGKIQAFNMIIPQTAFIRHRLLHF
ncbi:Uncharacterized protein APZ42_011873 [Daphnia magna]|uniref:Uncharacterized protein n=1 Tax=Daphnia magna TaxID=35525 RepID=A0A0P5Z2S4_9CRUS|nr:Uncharacterized protein APZ42_011873 [Daphnia magna]